MYRKIRSLARRLLLNRRPQELETWTQLLSLPRYVPGTLRSSRLDHPVHYADSASCASAGKAIFDSEIYKFKCRSDSPRIIDCGANIGLAILFWKKFYPNASIIAFEPDPDIFSVLKRNINDWGFDNVQLVPKAVGGRKGTLQFVREGADAGRVAGESDKDDSQLINIDMVTLDEFLSEHVDLLKVDIEGSEVELFTSIESQLDKVSNIFVEWHSFENRPQGLHTILQILNRAGFRYHVQPEFHSLSPLHSLRIHSEMDNRVNVFAFRTWPQSASDS